MNMFYLDIDGYKPSSFGIFAGERFLAKDLGFVLGSPMYDVEADKYWLSYKDPKPTQGVIHFHLIGRPNNKQIIAPVEDSQIVIEKGVWKQINELFIVDDGVYSFVINVTGHDLSSHLGVYGVPVKSDLPLSDPCFEKLVNKVVPYDAYVELSWLPEGIAEGVDLFVSPVGELIFSKKLIDWLYKQSSAIEFAAVYNTTC